MSLVVDAQWCREILVVSCQPAPDLARYIACGVVNQATVAVPDTLYSVPLNSDKPTSCFPLLRASAPQ